MKNTDKNSNPSISTTTHSPSSSPETATTDPLSSQISCSQRLPGLIPHAKFPNPYINEDGEYTLHFQLDPSYPSFKPIDAEHFIHVSDFDLTLSKSKHTLSEEAMQAWRDRTNHILEQFNELKESQTGRHAQKWSSVNYDHSGTGMYRDSTVRVKLSGDCKFKGENNECTIDPSCVTVTFSIKPSKRHHTFRTAGKRLFGCDASVWIGDQSVTWKTPEEGKEMEDRVYESFMSTTKEGEAAVDPSDFTAKYGYPCQTNGESEN